MPSRLTGNRSVTVDEYASECCISKMFLPSQFRVRVDITQRQRNVHVLDGHRVVRRQGLAHPLAILLVMIDEHAICADQENMLYASHRDTAALLGRSVHVGPNPFVVR